MIPLPKPFPDEAIGSVLARAAWHTGLPLKSILQSIYGATRSCSSLLMGTGFAKLSLATGLDAEELMVLHTVFPYATAFMPETTKQQLRAKALNPKPGKDCLSSLTKNVSHGVPYRRLCPRCVKDELATYGETYWHRQHMLPGALICIQHGERLAACDLPLRGDTQSRGVLLPHNVRQERIQVTLGPPTLLHLAQASSFALSTDCPSENLVTQYRNRALQLGYVIASGQVASMALSEKFQNFYGAGFLDESGCSVVGKPWPSLMLRPRALVPFATPKHVLLKSFLELDDGPVAAVEIGYTKPGKKPVDFKRLDTSLLVRLKAIADLAKTDDRRMTVKELLIEAGSWNPFKHHREKLPKSREFVLKFRDSDQSERQMGGRPYWRKRLPGRYPGV